LSVLRVRERADRFNAIGRPKSEAGERTVPLTPMLVNTLREWTLASGGQGLVFGNGVGKVESLANIINRGLIPPQIAAGVTKPRCAEDGTPLLDDEGKPVLTARYTGMHALRHFYASWCINTSGKARSVTHVSGTKRHLCLGSLMWPACRFRADGGRFASLRRPIVSSLFRADPGQVRQPRLLRRWSHAIASGSRSGGLRQVLPAGNSGLTTARLQRCRR
jgi:hypothetical protein